MQAKKTGRPKKELDIELFEELCKIQCTEQEICSCLGLTDKTLTRLCKEVYGKSFSDVFSQKRTAGFSSLRRTQWNLAKKNPTMAIFLGKQYLGQRDDKYINIEKKKAFDGDYLAYILRKDLFDKQKEVFDSLNKINICQCSRRAGKTVVASKLLIKKVLQFYPAILSNHSKEFYFIIIAKTSSQAYSLYSHNIDSELKKLSIPYKSKGSEGKLLIGEHSNGCILFSGSDTLDSVEKLRGNPICFFVIDEAQSQKYCNYLLNDILLPATKDFTDSQGLLIGTPPRTSGTTFERLYCGNNNYGKHHWTMADNIYLPNHENILEEIKKETGLKETDPLFQREYLGLTVYDDEALVYRISDKNYYEEEELLAFVRDHKLSLELLNGIDYGYSDNDAIVTFLSASDSKTKYLVRDWKKNHNTTSQIVDKIVEWSKMEFFPPTVKPYLPEPVLFWADCGGGGSRTNQDVMEALSKDLTYQSRVEVRTVDKVDKMFSVDKLRDDIIAGNIKIPRGCEFDIESKSIVWKRDKDDNLIQEIDDDAFHPDVADAVRYALREKWKIENERVERLLKQKKENEIQPEKPELLSFAQRKKNGYY